MAAAAELAVEAGGGQAGEPHELPAIGDLGTVLAVPLPSQARADYGRLGRGQGEGVRVDGQVGLGRNVEGDVLPIMEPPQEWTIEKPPVAPELGLLPLAAEFCYGLWQPRLGYGLLDSGQDQLD